jgi:hypothetical protein
VCGLRAALVCLDELAYEDSNMAVLVTYSDKDQAFEVLDLDRPEDPFTAGTLDRAIDQVRKLADRGR